jgi:ATP synthase protein I
MSDETNDSLKEFDKKLKAAGVGQEEALDEKERGGAGPAFRMATDLVAALVVGVGIGLLLDYWLGTKPWFLIGFFVLGAAAGMLNVYKVASGFGYAAGYKRQNGVAVEPDDELEK